MAALSAISSGARSWTFCPTARPPPSRPGWRIASEVEIVSRDRGGGWGQSVARAAPKAIQIADRGRLMENASRAFLDVARRSMTEIRRALGAGLVNPDS